MSLDSNSSPRSPSIRHEARLQSSIRDLGNSRGSEPMVGKRISEAQESIAGNRNATESRLEPQSRHAGYTLPLSQSPSSIPTKRWSAPGGFGAPSTLARFKFIPSPAGIFERSGKFFPELYTLQEGPASFPIHVYSAYEDYSSAVSRTNCYQFFFLASHRQWRRLGLSLTIRRNSRFWQYTKQTNTQVSYVYNYSLPQCFQSLVRQLISELQSLQDDTHLSLVVSEDSSTQNSMTWSQFIISPPTVARASAAMDVISNLANLGCKRYFENEITQIFKLPAPNCFAACLDGRFVYETKISTMAEDHSLYTIQLLQSLKGGPGIATLAGVVTDAEGRQLKSYLRETPAKTWMFNIISEALQTGPNIPWPRRERWAKQIIESVARIHSKGFVVGTLGKFKLVPINIDSHDRIILWEFRNKISTDDQLRLPGYLPPELRDGTPSQAFSPRLTLKNEFLDVTPQCDVFQLGAILWLLASNQKPTACRHFCKYEGCPMPTFCAKHCDMIALPPLPPDVPLYFQDIVSLCRTPEPEIRPSARQLLVWFPPGIDTMSGITQAGREEAQNLDHFSKVELFCDLCGTETAAQAYHCNLCMGGDYDLCAACFGIGRHCPDQAHFLVGMSVKSGVVVAENSYYSFAKEGGRRDVIHL